MCAPARENRALLLEVLHDAAALGLCLVGLHRLVLLASSAAQGPRLDPACDPTRDPRDPAELPTVTVQLPIYNERFVVEGLLRAVADLDYPPDRLEIQVLDDSTDSTSEIVAGLAEQLRSNGLAVRHLRRVEREGFKAGALASGLERASGELIAVFDADFKPPPEILRHMVPHFADPKVGLVQARWAYANRTQSLLTRVQAMQLDGHFLVEHIGRQNAGLPFNFNGTAGMLRRAAVLDSGGWQSETLTEDLDLSCRAHMAGWRFVYRPDLTVASQLPESIGAYKAQQRRWTRGSAQTARKLLVPLWRSRLALRHKLEASTLLLGNSGYLLLALFAIGHALAWCGSGLAARPPLRMLDTGLLGAATAVLGVFYAAAALRANRGVLPAVLEAPMLIALGAGMAPNNAIAFVQGLLGGAGTFQRTPKSPVGVRESEYRPDLGLATWLELPLCAGALWCSGAFWSRGWPGTALFYLLFGVGLGYVGLLSLVERLRTRPRRIAASARSAAQTGTYSAATTQAFSSQTPVAR
jgi:GT2 family glycosyltransferase